MQFSPNQDFKQSYSTLDRPTQHSMIQLNSRSPQHMSKSPLGFQELPQYQSMKKSLVSSDNPQLDDSPTSPKHTFTFPLQPNSYQQLNREQKINNEAGMTSAALRAKLSPSSRQQYRTDSNLQETFKGSKHSDYSGFELKKDQLLKEIFNDLKEHYFPSLIKTMKKEVMQEVLNIKTQMISLREETKTAIRKQQNQIFELKLTSNNFKNEARNRKSSHSSSSPDMQTHFFLLQAKMAQLQTKFQNSLKEHQEKLINLESKLSQRNVVNFGSLKSSLPPLLVQYKEVMTLKQPQKNAEFLLEQSVYYIDCHGYLLDHENYYIVDSTGSKIRLQDKHLKLLSLEKITGE